MASNLCLAWEPNSPHANGSRLKIYVYIYIYNLLLLYFV